MANPIIYVPVLEHRRRSGELIGATQFRVRAWWQPAKVHIRQGRNDYMLTIEQALALANAVVDTVEALEAGQKGD
ncbi:hypothetical protein [Corynebacterium provencense]|uniref:hypothetical protein n=1 Tax=Corynebacterium provencense TaxID=1737425 RepID=UPI00082AB7EC|nr:hypothetical protein [Corynebacterium provencense]